MKRFFHPLLAIFSALAALIGLLVSVQLPAFAEVGDTHTIYQIQYTATPGSGNTYPSLYVNQTITTSGVVYAIYTGKGFFIAEDTGPWHAIYVYNGSGSKPNIGDKVQVRGQVSEYYGLTELGSNPTYIVLSTGNSVYTPSLVTTADIPYNNTAISEGYESVLVEIHNLTVTVAVDTYKIWTFTDAAGSSGKADDWGYRAEPAVGQQYDLLRGPLVYDFSEYKVMPRSSDDLILKDTTSPTVTATTPLSGATGVSPYQPLYATFNEPISDTTVLTGFQVVGPGGSILGEVYYQAATRQAVFRPLSPLAFNSQHTATLTTDIQDVNGNALATPYTWSFETGAADTTWPAMTGHTPPSDAVDVSVNTSIVITFSEELKPETVNTGNFFLFGPAGALTWSNLVYDPATYRVTLTPPTLAYLTSYTVEVGTAVTDWAGNVITGTRSWSFTTAAEAPMQAYHGDIHNHTSYSDGSGTPAQALTAGQAAGFDFMAITDHSYAIDDTEWANTLTAAEAATAPGQFVALRGFEYTQGAEGHINVYNSTRHAVRTNTGCATCDYTPNLEQGVTVEGFYHWLSITGTQAVDSLGTVMEFNHPGWINFNDWTYHPEVEAIARLEEIGNGNGVSYVFSEEEFIRSLDYGWKVSATNNADTHSNEWGTNTDHRTGIWLPDLSKGSLLTALRARRTFATEDKNYELRLKANDAWMGSEVANTGQLNFDISGFDPDGEVTTLAQLVTFGGAVVAQTQPNSASFTWQPVIPVSSGTHYYYVKTVQPDGDRIISSPIWTTGTVDVRLTDLTAEPTIATLYNPTMFTARVTNRTGQTQTLTVNFQIDGTPHDVVVTVGPCQLGPCVDAYANITWQPTGTGQVTVTANLSAGVPGGDNLADNQRAVTINVVDQKVPLVLIDGGHNNIGGSPSDARLFVNDLTQHGYNVLFNLDTIDATDLNTETVKLLIINAYGPDQLTSSEIQAIANFVQSGGSLWLNGMADYTGKVAWAGTLAQRMNELIVALETATGQPIPIRINSDEVLDGDDNNGYPWGVLWHSFPFSHTTGIGMNVTQIQSWSDCSLVDQNNSTLEAGDLGANGFIAISGDLDSGNGTYGYPNRTNNENSNSDGPPYYPYLVDTLLAGAAGYDIPGPAGRLFFYGDSNDPFNIFAYTAGDGKQNELFNLETVMWLLGEPVQKQTIAQARAYTTANQPTNLDKLVWVEGRITAAYGEFFNVLYVQDDTGGITVHAPAGDIAAGAFARGATVRVLGTVGIYQGDTEIEFFEAEQVQVLTPTTGLEPAPLLTHTYSASLELNEGWLFQVTGQVISKTNDYDFTVDDGSGPVRVFIDGYNGNFAGLPIGSRVQATGLASEDGNGHRLRVRKQADVIVIQQTSLSMSKTASSNSNFSQPNPAITYTITLSNSGSSDATGVVMTDVLPISLTFGNFLGTVPTGTTQAGNAITWTGTVSGSSSPLLWVFTTTLNINSNPPSQVISNTAHFTSTNAGSGSVTAVFGMTSQERKNYLPVIIK